MFAAVLEKMHAKGLPHSADVPVVDRDTFIEADGFIFGEQDSTSDVDIDFDATQGSSRCRNFKLVS